jgi:hypothetical protein
MADGNGTKEDPWRVKTPPNTSEYTRHKDEKDGRPYWSVLSARRPALRRALPGRPAPVVGAGGLGRARLGRRT